jgi:hypothetical protein
VEADRGAEEAPARASDRARALARVLPRGHDSPLRAP